MKTQKGITLVALIITIIVMLILAGVSISSIISEDGIINKATLAEKEVEIATEEEENDLKLMEEYIKEKTQKDLILSHSGKLIDGAYYMNVNTGMFYDTMPESVNEGDMYLFGDYIYTYNSSSNCWYVQLATDELNITTYISDYPVTDRNQTSYGSILDSINGVHIGSLYHTFENCTSLIVAPKIPKTVTGMSGAFSGCSSLTTVPELPSDIGDLDGTFRDCISLIDLSNLVIPSSIFCMNGTFYGCTNLVNAPIIPDAELEMSTTFKDCTSLKGNIEINANPIRCEGCFEGTTNQIKIIGDCSEETKGKFVLSANNNNVTY